MKKLVVVESPAKAKTINKYLGNDYKVVASFGHVRDLPSKKGSVLPEEDFALTYEVDKDSAKRLKDISDNLKEADTLILATDPDREGEGISWHIIEALKEKKKLPKRISVQRVAFNQITKEAVKKAIENPREIDIDLVNAQQARRVLDYLVGFTLSPILWRKLPGSRSAGRVQSVALRLICEREAEIEIFKPVEYWDIKAQFQTIKEQEFEAKLSAINEEKIDKFFIKKADQAGELEQDINSKKYAVSDITSKIVKRRPYAPFTTSTLQQEGVYKLGFVTKRTMSVAQKLYEGIAIEGEVKGLITYMRTDGVTIAADAIANIRDFIGKEYGDKYLPKSPNIYKSKVKNAQEAHEAIRPTDINITPDYAAKFLTEEQAKLYRLIWQRTVASQMMPQESLQTAITISSTAKEYQFRAVGTIIKFKGFTEIYKSDNNNEQLLPDVKEQENLDLNKTEAKQHFTEPPPRYNEASLVKKLEELGIGRPSTYASIISILLDRQYARLESKKFFPEERGVIVTTFLVEFFEKYLEYDFTANLEEGLDDIADGKISWKEFMSNFWSGFSKMAEHVGQKEAEEVTNKLTEILAHHYFRNEEGEISRSCPNCDDGILGLRMGKFGAFIACGNYPDCKYTKQLSEEEGSLGEEGENILGVLKNGYEVELKKGPYGHYLEILDGAAKPKRASIPKFIDPATLDMNLAEKITSLPKVIGTNPKNDKDISVNNGKFGPYLVNNGVFYSIGNDDLFTIELEKALEVINNSKKSGGEAKELGEYPETKEIIKLTKGRYGPYLKMGKKNIALPKGTDHEKLTLEEAIDIVKAKLK